MPFPSSEGIDFRRNTDEESDADNTSSRCLKDGVQTETWTWRKCSKVWYRVKTHDTDTNTTVVSDAKNQNYNFSSTFPHLKQWNHRSNTRNLSQVMLYMLDGVEPERR